MNKILLFQGHEETIDPDRDLVYCILDAGHAQRRSSV